MHIAFIMDGNGRWAVQRGLPRAKGHEQGIETANEIMMACVERRIAYATFYGFSVQNWSRTRSEIETIYEAGHKLLQRMRPWLKEHNVKVQCIGTKSRGLKEKEPTTPTIDRALDLAQTLMDETKEHTGTVITLCLSYGGREEILDVFRSIDVPLDQLTTAMVSTYFQVPDVDFVIRTSGEQRISNFLLWQSAYAEYHFTPTLWPDFHVAELDQALDLFRTRNRRFGAIPGPKEEETPLEELLDELFAEYKTPAPLKTCTTTFPTDIVTFPLRERFEQASIASKGATTLLFVLYELPEAERKAVCRALAHDFSIETLEHMFRTPFRLLYIDMEPTERVLLQRICALYATADTFKSRIGMAYCGLKLYLKQLLHEDAFILWSILLTFCADVLERRYTLSYFEDANLYSIITNVIQDTVEGETQTEAVDIMRDVATAITIHYFYKSIPTMPKGVEQMAIWCLEQLSVRFTSRAA
jgi:undecaprenyl diphosphate synthase